ncbi:unnamed protein product [Cuscuta campestris]|uniref:Uncharacterized protein n=1 Tax=Cuscuta campestris TaxID=132261 RepID=A0A484MK14_9ASTE|nr:unnamed protein product [Cuscuta campestris]
MKTVSNIWQIAKAQLESGLPIDVQCHWKGSCGRKRVLVDMEKMAAIPLSRRKNMCALSFAMEVSKSTVHRWLKHKDIRRHLSAIKPYLCESEEPDPYRTTQSKSFIPKIMFLAAVGRPRYGEGGDVLWDGKIGIFPFTFEEAAQRGAIPDSSNTKTYLASMEEQFKATSKAHASTLILKMVTTKYDGNNSIREQIMMMNDMAPIKPLLRRVPADISGAAADGRQTRTGGGIISGERSAVAPGRG